MWIQVERTAKYGVKHHMVFTLFIDCDQLILRAIIWIIYSSKYYQYKENKIS